MREMKTRREISDWMTRQLNGRPGCTETKVTVQYELKDHDADGCNWSRDIVLNYGRDDSAVVDTNLRPLFEEARRRFNVCEP